jgi:aspartate/methionine/tyrosine aminotransferase
VDDNTAHLIVVVVASNGPTTRGAYYIYADVTHLTSDSVQLCKRILETTGVACVPGVDFDRERGRTVFKYSHKYMPHMLNLIELFKVTDM